MASITHSWRAISTVRVGGRARRKMTAATMLAPLMVVVLAFLGWPIIWTLVLSLTNKSITGPTASH